jgi:hypothetical protein
MIQQNIVLGGLCSGTIFAETSGAIIGVHMTRGQESDVHTIGDAHPSMSEC